MAFFFAPKVYAAKLFSEQNRNISTIYFVSLLIDFYLICSGAGYLLSLIFVVVQALSLTWFVSQAIGGPEFANKMAYAMTLKNTMQKMSELVGAAKK